jgi:uncharacterized protein (DUF2147 family)
MAVRAIAAAAFGMLALSAAAAPAASVEGNWLTQEKTGIVAIARCGDALCGRLVWLRITPSDNNPQAIDNRNPAPELRGRKLCGMTLMWGFRPDGPDRWGGAIYDPASGSTYRATMTLRPDGRLDMRGYVLVSLFGRSEAWTRFAQPIPPCPARH